MWLLLLSVAPRRLSKCELKRQQSAGYLANNVAISQSTVRASLFDSSTPAAQVLREKLIDWLAAHLRRLALRFEQGVAARLEH